MPIPCPTKGKHAAQPTLDFAALTDERVERNDSIDQLRDALHAWRSQGYPGVTAISRKLLLHWADASREDRILFAQREAAETAIYLAEVTGRDRGTRCPAPVDRLRRLGQDAGDLAADLAHPRTAWHDAGEHRRIHLH